MAGDIEVELAARNLIKVEIRNQNRGTIEVRSGQHASQGVDNATLPRAT